MLRHAEVVKWLLTAEVGMLRLLETRAEDGKTAFLSACFHGYLECMKVLQIGRSAT